MNSKLVLIVALCASALSAQTQTTATVSGKLTLDSSAIAKKLYGRLPVFHSTAVLKNYGPATVNIGGSDINIALSTVPIISSSEGQALTNQAYQQQTPQKVGNIITLIATGVGAAVGAGAVVNISKKLIGWLLFGVGFGPSVLNFFDAGNPALPTFNPCDQLNVSLSVGQSLSCDAWVEKPAKGAPLLSSVYSIDLEAVPPVAPLPPTPPTVQLRRRTSAITVPTQPSAALVGSSPTAAPYPQCWTEAVTGVRMCRNMNGVIFRQDVPQGAPNVIGPEPRSETFHVNHDLAELPATRPSVHLALTSWDVSAKIAIVADPADDVAQLMETYRKALPGLKQSVRDSPLCGVCWRALAVAQLLLLEDDMAMQGFQMADELERPRVLRLARAF